MPYFKHARTGKVINVEEGVRLISVWEPVEKEKEVVREDDKAPAVTEDLPVFKTVEDLRKKAPKTGRAMTSRGTIYEPVDGIWRKVK